MTLSDLLADSPAPRIIADARAAVRQRLGQARQRLAVVDDDPTGTQTVHGVHVYMDWSVKRLRAALACSEPVFYISTNSRSLTAAEATDLSWRVGRNLGEAARHEGSAVVLVSRSDSTLRGHFPHEVAALAAGMGLRPDGVIIAPAFFEAGRYTVGDVHWVEHKGLLVPADETEFARDPVFGYRHANLRQWVEEKTGGKVAADQVRAISLETIRAGGVEAVAHELMAVSNATPVVVNAACYEDLEVFVLGLLRAEEHGKVFIHRCAASLVKVLGGFGDRSLLTTEEMEPGEGPGLVVVGSYVQKTSRQLEALLASGLAVGVELRADQLLETASRNREMKAVAAEADRLLRRGETVAVYTSRTALKDCGQGFLQLGQVIMSSLIEVVRRLTGRPGFLVAKGGITSLEVARKALGAEEAMVLGQILDGVPVWRFGPESRWPGVPYVVFPGNVGDEGALVEVVRCLSRNPG